MWKKSVHSLLFFVLAVTVVLSGCSSSSSNGEKKPSSSSQEGSGDGKLAPYEITIAFWGPDQRDLGLVEQEISKITKEKINATVKLKRIEAAAWTQQKVLMFSGNEKLDLVFTGEDQYISEVAQKSCCLSMTCFSPMVRISLLPSILTYWLRQKLTAKYTAFQRSGTLPLIRLF